MQTSSSAPSAAGSSTPASFPPLSKPLSGSSKLKRFYIIRHGQTDANAAGVLQGRGINLPLSESGKEQGRLLGERFKNEKVDLIVVSSLQRTRETAMYIHQYHPHAEILEIQGLDEISWGVWEGRKFNPGLDDLAKEWSHGNFNAKAPNGDSPFDVEARSTVEIYKLLSRPETNIACVVHGRLIRILLASIINRNLTVMNNYSHHNTSINVLDVIMDPTLDPKTLEEFTKSGATFIPRKGYVRDLPPDLELDESDIVVKGEPVNGAVTCVEHPAGVAFKAIVLDDRGHLPIEMAEH
ncbi:hypothetical protein HDU76_007898 [Blyttiomyces sp. JEL0837]|nr:hypothetical protein HDU76_007898 [Blyttiomyces sp. JEL0837]